MPAQKNQKTRRGVMKRKRCGVCPGCVAPECGNCRYCMDMKKRGGSGTLRRPCEKRGCVATSSGEVRDTAKRAKSAKAEPAVANVSKSVSIDGRIFGSTELCDLCQAVAEEQTDSDADINWDLVAAKLQAREISFDALLTLRHAATRLEDEARALETAKNKEKNSKNLSSTTQRLQPKRTAISTSRKGVRSRTGGAMTADDIKVYEYPHPRLRDILPSTTNTLSRSKMHNQIQTKIQHQSQARKASSKDERWSPARCRVLWRWLAYAQDPPSSTSDDASSSEVSSFTSDDDRNAILDPWEQAYRAQSRKDIPAQDSHLLDFKQELPPRPRTNSDSSSRLGDLTAAAFLCEKQNPPSPTKLPSTSSQSVQSQAQAPSTLTTPALLSGPYTSLPHHQYQDPVHPGSSIPLFQTSQTQNVFGIPPPPQGFAATAAFLPPPPGYPADTFSRHRYP